ncbi:hypothetical protein AVEN_85121-1 [Araneus ventricosus]|uniref:Uncharacterized protein n=1 Tax=Araneus ventricosus TaxID=182803 RepID=A0A4Y2N6E4_ARAVE|nr:hypothetical protein AVEN_85121-1 [Araneus ventricosus]
MKRTIFVKFPDGSDELICNQSTRLVAVSHLDWNKGPGSRFLKSSGQFPKHRLTEHTSHTAPKRAPHVKDKVTERLTCNRKPEVKAEVSGGDWRVEAPAGGWVGCGRVVSSELEAIAKRGARARLHMIFKTFIPTQRALRKRRKEKPPLRAIGNQHVLERENKARPLSVRKMEYEPTRFRSTAKDR